MNKVEIESRIIELIALENCGHKNFVAKTCLGRKDNKTFFEANSA